MACAFAGAEFAEPAATLGVRIGRVISSGSAGLAADANALFGETHKKKRGDDQAEEALTDGSSSNGKENPGNVEDSRRAFARELVELRKREALVRLERDRVPRGARRDEASTRNLRDGCASRLGEGRAGRGRARARARAREGHGRRRVAKVRRSEPGKSQASRACAARGVMCPRAHC